MKKDLLQTSTFIVATTVYGFSLLGWITLQSFQTIFTKWGRHSELTIFLKPETQIKDSQRLERELNRFRNQINFQIKGSTEIADELKNILSTSPSSPSDVKELSMTIPPYYIVKAKNEMIGDSIYGLFHSIEEGIKNFSFVDSVNYGQTWIAKYESAVEAIDSLNLTFLASLSMTLVLVIGNSIRSHIHSRKEEIEILELVGATPQMIRKPYLIEGTILSLSSMFMALSFLTAMSLILVEGKISIANLIQSDQFLYQLDFIDWSLSLLISALIGYVGSALCLAELSQGWSISDLYFKFMDFFKSKNSLEAISNDQI